MDLSIDIEGYTLIKLPYWISPLTSKQVHTDMFDMIARSGDMTWTDIYAFGRELNFLRTDVLRVMGEFDRKDLIAKEAMFKVDDTKPTMLRLYIKRKYEMIELLPYTIIEKIILMKLILTFSIETGTGHEVPFFAEVTCDTILPMGIEPRSPEEIVYIRRVVNCALKFFWIHFDAYKIVLKGMDRLQRWVAWYIKYTDILEEENMDKFLSGIEELIRARNPDEYTTKEALIAIGVEYEVVAVTYPEYPRVHILVEKVRVRPWTIDKEMIIADETDIWIDEILDMVVSI